MASVSSSLPLSSASAESGQSRFPPPLNKKFNVKIASVIPTSQSPLESPRSNLGAQLPVLGAPGVGESLSSQQPFRSPLGIKLREWFNATRSNSNPWRTPNLCASSSKRKISSPPVSSAKFV